MDFKLIYLARRNPSVAPDDWPRIWRSHAVFASQFPVIGAKISNLFYCNRVRAPKLNSAPFDPPGASQDYDGVAVVAGPGDGFGDGEMDPADRAKIDQDELRVFSTYTPNFTLQGKEVLVEGGVQGQAAVIRFLARKPGASREEFMTHWSRHHADIGKRAAGSGAVARYVHNEITKSPPPGYPFDAVTETWFAKDDDAAKSFVDGPVAALGKDLPAFCDVERTVTMLTGVIHRWPRAR
jgi:hypothetical protein